MTKTKAPEISTLYPFSETRQGKADLFPADDLEENNTSRSSNSPFLYVKVVCDKGDYSTKQFFREINLTSQKKKSVYLKINKMLGE